MLSNSQLRTRFKMSNVKNNSTHSHPVVDNTDWLKAAAIILVLIDHIGYFFIENADWWSVIGRLAAPIFFFLLGYAQSRTVPFRWLWIGFVLTLLDSLNNDMMWMAPNILLSFALIRIARPHVKTLLLNHGWLAFACIVIALVAVLPLTRYLVDYGAEGWLWALFGLCQRMYVDQRPAITVESTPANFARPAPATLSGVGLMRLLACIITAAVYIWQEQVEFLFSTLHFASLTMSVVLLAAVLCFFQRGASRIQPSRSMAVALRFIGRHTLEIYAIALAGFEITILFLPHLAA